MKDATKDDDDGEDSAEGSDDDESSEESSEGSSSDSGEEEQEAEEASKPAASEIASAAKTAEEVTKRNSTTNKREWDVFSRQCLDRKKFPVSLASHLQRDKTDLFNLWLDNNQDLQKVAIVVERSVEQKTTSRSGFEASKARDIIKMYGETKGQKLVKALRAKGRFYWDDDFPEDEEEIFYYTHARRKVLNDNSTANKLKIEAHESNPDTALVASLTGEEGPLHAGAMPGMKIDNIEGEKDLALALSNGGTVGKIKPPKKKTETTEKVLPTTSKERAEAVLDDILKDGGAARKLALALAHVEYGDSLKQELMDFSAKMEDLYSSLQRLILKKVTKAKKYDPFLNEVEERGAWYKKAEKAARGLLAGLKKKKKTTTKAKAGAAAPDKPSEGTPERGESKQ
ncbi:unnamed protein product [Symbiodinium sp. CCMP2592]|nr:unnamed protein product [Symbiodinium sp. CCMP2592]